MNATTCRSLDPTCRPTSLRGAAFVLGALVLAWYGHGLMVRAAAPSGGETLQDLGDPGLATPPAGGAGSAPAAAPDAAAPATTAPTGRDAEAPRQRTMLDTLKDGGLTGAVILLLSVVAVGYIIEHSLTIRRSTLMPDRAIDDLEEMIADGKIDDAIQYCEAEKPPSLVSSIILAGLTRFKTAQFGFAEYKSAVEEAGEEETSRLYRKTEVLNVIGAIAPMLGLLGTVEGMIEAFNTIASKGGMARPDELAGSIGKALVTTLEGLVVAIPALIACSFFRNRIDSLVSEAGNRIERVLLPLGRQK